MGKPVRVCLCEVPVPQPATLICCWWRRGGCKAERSAHRLDLPDDIQNARAWVNPRSRQLQKKQRRPQKVPEGRFLGARREGNGKKIHVLGNFTGAKLDSWYRERKSLAYLAGREDSLQNALQLNYSHTKNTHTEVRGFHAINCIPMIR